MQLTPYFEWGKNFVDKLNLSSYSCILDLGCRQGLLSSYLSKLYPNQHFLAVDSYQKNIDIAKQYALSNLCFKQEDLFALPYRECFDAIISINCLHWIENKLQVLEEAYAALKPEGKLYLQFFIKHGRPQNDRFFYQTARQINWHHQLKIQANYYEITIEALCLIFNNIGYMINHLSFIEYPIIFKHSEMLKNWFKSWAPCIHQLPLSKRDHFIEEATVSYLNYHDYSKEKPVTYYEYLLEAILEKPKKTSLELRKYCYQNICFTQREAQILKYSLQGKSAKEIAILLPITAKTVEFHLAKIKEKLNCQKRSEIFKRAISDGFITLMFDNKL